MAMINLSYNLSQNTKSSLQKIEDLRAKLLLTPLSPRTELKLKWNTMVNKTHWSLILNDNELTKPEIIKLLSNLSSKKKFSNEEKEVLSYKKGLDYISQEWLVTERNISSKVIVNLHDICSEGRLTVAESSIKQILDYLQASTEHPVIKAGVLQIALLSLSPFSKGNGRTSRLATYLLLYKFGYDFRGLLCIDEYFKKDLVGYEENVQRVMQGANLSLWIEYFVKGVENQLEKALTEALQEKYSMDFDKNLFDLNDRQKEILSILDQPNMTITNKKAQKMFKVSQITASRDLSRLATLGLLYAHGKGRSVYYSKI